MNIEDQPLDLEGSVAVPATHYPRCNDLCEGDMHYLVSPSEETVMDAGYSASEARRALQDSPATGEGLREALGGLREVLANDIEALPDGVCDMTGGKHWDLVDRSAVLNIVRPPLAATTLDPGEAE